MAIHFIIDSGSDILPDEAKAWGITLLPLTVRFGTTEYRDAVDLTHRQFYEKLIECEELPTTSQITPFAYEEAIAPHLAAGEEVVVMTVSSKLSGTYQSACIAASAFDERVYVLDTENVCVGMRILLQRGLELQSAGLSAAEIVSCLEKEKKQIQVMALLDTLEYLKKGGRIPATVALAGSLLSIKPVIEIKDGVISMAGKARGSKQGNNLLREMVQKVGGICFEKPFALAYSGLSDVMLQKYITDSSELWQNETDSLPITTVGCSIGAHAGPGTVAIAFFANENQKSE